MSIDVFVLDADYIVIDGKPVVRLFCMQPDSGRVILYDPSFRPYCFVESDRASLTPETKDMPFIEEIQETEMLRLGRKIKVCKVFTKLPEDVPKLRQLSFRVYEADIPFYKRYLLDNEIGSYDLVRVDVDGDRIKSISKLKLAEAPIKAMAFDIETFSKRSFPDSKVDPIIAISFSDGSNQHCITWLKAEGENIERVEDEAQMIMKFTETFSKSGANAIVGYNSDSFDMPYIQERARILGIKPLFNGFEIKSKGQSRKFSEINGTAHIDILDFIRNIYAIYNLKTEVLTLREVASEVLNEKKGDFDWEKVDEVFSDGAAATSLCTYCMQDSHLTFKLYSRLMPLISEFNKLIGQTFSDVSRMTTGAVVENLIMRKAHKIGELIPNKPSEFEVESRMRKINEGAFVFQPKPGLYKDVAVADFRSLYPSIIVSHNICPSTIKHDSNVVSFAKKDEKVGLIPSVVEEILNLRFDAKSRLKLYPDDSRLKARVMVLKLVANGFYGYLGYYNSRWYCFECAGAITSYGRDYVHSVIDTAMSMGFDVIYADTDSAFITKEGISGEINGLISAINSKLPKPMELELQGVYLRALFVSSKSGMKGAKKKYAMCDSSSNLIIKGFQSVRRDWAVIAKETQRRVLEFILIKNDFDSAVSYVKDVVNRINSGTIPLEKLGILTRLRKDISSYHQTGRHVSAAEKSGRKFSSGDTIRYIISKGKPGDSISERAVLFDIAKQNKIKYDPQYYVDNQVLPSVMSIFEVFGLKEEDFIGRKDSSLGDFFDASKK
ncbi:DNA-directed DNA polymerase [Candidatus Parvarchaeota archaeon]|nr:DNA-directed DNA polymerase [Candidatus Parvarchaeota archaeon]